MRVFRALIINFILVNVSCFFLPHSSSPTFHSNQQQQQHQQQAYYYNSRLLLHQGRKSKTKPTLSLSLLSPPEQELALWITSFSTLHIGMSAIRDSLITSCGELAANANLINRQVISLPSWWPGDDVGKDEIFPDQETAGRQIYRVVYTFVSFFTLGGALSTYLSILQTRGEGIDIPVGYNEQLMMSNIPLTEQEYMVYFAIASISFGASIASLFNASPLSLMPGFQKVDDEKEQISTSKSSIGGIQRNDGLKFEPKGLTRITRHPLILPVVPWGIATSVLLGGI